MQAKKEKEIVSLQKRNDVSSNVSTTTDPETLKREKDKGKTINAA